jgi:hypothetical protein
VGEVGDMRMGDARVGGTTRQELANTACKDVRAAWADDKSPSTRTAGESLRHPYRKLHDADRRCRIHVAIIVALLAAGIALVEILLRGTGGGQAGATYGRAAIAASRPLTTGKSRYRVHACRMTGASKQPRHSLFTRNLLVEPDAASPTA